MWYVVVWTIPVWPMDRYSFHEFPESEAIRDGSPGISASTGALTSVPHQPDLCGPEGPGNLGVRYWSLSSTRSYVKVVNVEEVLLIPGYIAGKYLLLGQPSLTGLPHHLTTPTPPIFTRRDSPWPD